MQPILSKRSEERLRLQRHLFGEPLSAITERLAESRRLRRLPTILEKRFSDPAFGLTEAARLCRLSGSHLNALLVRRCGMSFPRLLAKRRLLKACRLLRETDLSVKEVAFACGFGSPRTFLRRFESSLGTTPTKFRSRFPAVDTSS